MAVMSKSQELMTTILKSLPSEAEITRIEYEGPRISIYTKNYEFLASNNYIISDIVNTVKRRIVIRTDKSIRKKENEATEILKNSIAEQSVLSGVEGLQHITKDDSLLIEDNADGRILFFSSSGELLWEYVNKAEDGKNYRLNWSRLIEEKKIVKTIKENIIGLKCN